MLSRTAGELFWTGRYVERADFIARLTDATLRLAALPSYYGGDVSAWTSALVAAGVSKLYAEKHPKLSEKTALHFLSLDSGNPSSMVNCIERARSNARSVRSALTVEVWEAINTAWLEMQKFGPKLGATTTISRMVEQIKASALAFDGATHRTMLRDQGYWFLRLGAVLERADNTARLLEVKYNLLLPSDEPVGGSLDYFQWTTILRTVSALTAYRHVYRDNVKPWLVADLLILNTRMPRSLAACTNDAARYLDDLAQRSGKRGAANRQAAALANRLEKGRMEQIFASGLHEYTTEFLAANARLGDAIMEQYLF